MTRIAFTLLASLGFVSLASGQSDYWDDPNLKLALTHFNDGKKDECLAALKLAVEKNPKLQHEECILATWLVQSKNSDQARPVLEKFIARNPDHPDGYLLNASFAFREGRTTDAHLNCTLAWKFSSSPKWKKEQVERFRREARLGLAAVYEARGNGSEAANTVLGLINDDPNNITLRQYYVRMLLKADNLNVAYAELVKLYRNYPNQLPPEVRMAEHYTNKDGKREEVLRNRKEAESYLMQALEKYPDDRLAQRAAARFYLDEMRLTEAFECIEAARKLDGEKEVYETQILLGQYCRIVGTYAADSATRLEAFTDAVAIFTKLYELDPSSTDVMVGYAICLAELGGKENSQRAIDIGESLVRCSFCRREDTFTLIAWVLFKADKVKYLNRAENVIKAAIKFDKLSLDAAYYAACILNERGKYDDARKILKEAIFNAGPFVYRTDAVKLFRSLDEKQNTK